MMNMQFISPSLILSLILSVVLAALYGWLYVDIQSKNAASAQVLAEIQARDGEERRLQSLEMLIEQTEEERVRLDQHFVSSEDITQFLEQVEALGVTSGTSLEIVSVVEAELVPPDEEYNAYVVALSAEGPFSAVSELLARIEGIPYPVQVTQARFEARGLDKKKVWVLSVSFMVLKKKT